jgi:hypothetical protein
LQFPVSQPSRVAILCGGFSTDGRSIREFPPESFETLSGWRPGAIAAPLATLLTLADRKLRGLFDPGPDLALLLVLTQIEGETLGEDYREYLWQAFGVPLFEQLRDRAGTVIARECEAHDGLHVDSSAHLSEAATNDPCECGLT